ncbi:MAG TPA: recombinase family protein [Ruminiclostridium sp.]|nr:recombinase family protein [Ruminiclostridium sp.]
MDVRKVRAEIMGGRSLYDLPLRVTFYARVSTEKEEQASSLENQITYYSDFIRKNKNWTYVDGYVDEGISGTSTLKRESFNRMILDAKRGLFDFIITKEISRFSRSTLDSIQYTQELLRNNVGVFFQSDNINTLDTDSEFRLVVMAGVAQDEVRKLSERLKFGFRQSIKNGRVLGNDRLWGYDKNDCKLAINEEEAKIIRLIFDLYVNERIGMRKISQKLLEYGITSREGNAFNTTTIRHILNNPKYKGYYCGNKTKSIDYKLKKNVELDESEWVCYKDEDVPAIVSEELWNKAHNLLQYRSKALRSSGAEFHNRYPYSGKIICAEHGTSFHRQVLHSQKGDKEVWQCRTYRTRGLAGCSAPQLRTAELDRIMADIFTQVNKDRDKIINQILMLIKSSSNQRDYGKEKEKLEEEIRGIYARKDKLLEMSIDSLITNAEFKTRNDNFNRQLELKQKGMEQLSAEQEKSRSETENLSRIKEALTQELNFENGINSALVAAIIDKIVVKNRGDRNRISLDIYLKMGEKIPVEYDRKNLSFCDNTS